MGNRPPLVCGGVVEKVRFTRSPAEFLVRHGTRYDVTRMRLPAFEVGTTEYVVVSDPALAVEVLTSPNYSQFSDLRQSVPFGSPPVSATTDVSHDVVEEFLATMFTGPEFASAIERAESSVAEDVAAVAPGEYDAGDLLRHMTARSMASVLFDRVPSHATTDRISTSVHHGGRMTSLGGLSGVLPVWLPTFSAALFGVHGWHVKRWVDGAVEAAPDDALVRRASRQVGGLSEQQIKGNVRIPFVAGFLGPEVMLSTALALLLSDRPTLTDVRARLESVPAPLAYGDLAPVRSALRHVLYEAIRLFPPTFFVSRVAVDDATLGGYEIPAGTTLWIDQLSIGRDPQSWVAPDEFRPDRWDSKSTRRDAFLPFGRGGRDCPGKDVAMVQGELILANLLRRFEIEGDGTEPTLADVTGGLSLSFSRPSVELTAASQSDATGKPAPDPGERPAPSNQ